MYFILRSDSPLGKEAYNLQRIDQFSKSWMTGDRFGEGNEPPSPLRLRVDPEIPGDLLLEYYEAPVPLMSKRLVDALQQSGVDNLDVYPAEIIDESSGDVIDSYFAVNIIGTVSAADPEQSVTDPEVEGIISAAFDSLVIDEEAAGGQLIFRLAEDVSAVLVSERVVDAIEPMGFETLEFVDPEDWVSL